MGYAESTSHNPYILSVSNTELRIPLSVLCKFQEFLNKMNLCLNVKDDDIRQWHSKFVLDDVPEVEPASLPQPPVVKKFMTAKDVLDELKEKHVDPKVSHSLGIYDNTLTRVHTVCLAGPCEPRVLLNRPDLFSIWLAGHCIRQL